MTPPSAKTYAAQMVKAMYAAPRKVRRRSLLAPEMESLIALAYDAGVLAQQRFAERKNG